VQCVASRSLLGPGTGKPNRDYGLGNRSGFVTYVLRVIRQITAMLAPIKKNSSWGVVISVINTLSYKLFLPLNEALSMLFLQDVIYDIQVSLLCVVASV
jgi:hypothetical protein